MSFDLKLKQGKLIIGGDGDLQKVENTEKLIQDILKIATTPLNGNPFQPQFGSLISTTLVGNPLPMDFLTGNASSQIRNCLENLQRAQREQQARQTLTASEQLAAIQSVNVERNQTDPRFWQIVIRVLARDFSGVTAQLTVSSI